ncbi:IS1096 element passenger TnpR family protein, partial [Pseudonocardia alni]|uniref:IS1096 element passenger TnpR family protein n=1 Tax=Pseudonocardia alni TaxID=33907 RepID=UPI0033F3622D
MTASPTATTSATTGPTRCDSKESCRARTRHPALCTGGRRPGPPEDCGGVDGYEMWCAATDATHAQHTLAVAEIRNLYGPEIDLAAHAPTAFDLDEINDMLGHAAPDDADLPEPLAARIRAIGDPAGRTWLRAALDTVAGPEIPDETTATVVVHP